MQTLRELQMAFAAEVYDGVDRGLDALIHSNGLSAARRLRVYRNNIVSSLGDALRAVYPVVQRLVGEEFFDHLASQYLQAYPSRCGDVREFGEQMPVFIATFPALAMLPYLHDVACLEWSYHSVFHAAHQAPLDLARLNTIAPEYYEKLKFQMHSASRLLESPYPILRIWQVNQPDFSDDVEIDLSAGGDRLLLIRRELDVEVEVLSNGAYALLAALRDGNDVASASGAALVAQPDLDLGTAFQYFVLHHVLVEFTL